MSFLRHDGPPLKRYCCDSTARLGEPHAVTCPRHDVQHGFDCGDIWCQPCTAQRAAKATARRTAARKGAARRARR